MKKSLIALAALSAFATAAQAQSSVTVYGIMDLGYTSVENTLTASGASTSEKVTSTGNGDGALATSRLGFRGTEDLGSGLRANFQLEYDLKDVGTGGTSLGARYSWVGLQDAKMGQLRLGRQEQSIHSVITAGSAGYANNMAGTIYSAGSSDSKSFNYASVRPHGVFVDQAVTYISPSMGGVVVELQTGEQKTVTTGAADAKTSTFGASVKYTAGKLALAAGTNTAKNTDNTALLGTDGTNDNAVKRVSQAISASYNMGVVQPFLLYTTDKATRANGTVERDTKVTEVGVRAPVGKTTFFGSTFKGDMNGGNGQAYNHVLGGLDAVTMATADVKGYQIGAVHDLSKRTSLYAIYGTQEVKGTAADAGEKVKSDGMAVGVRHSF